ncbi:unnamed protein product [Thelazia callipaeda]|uniref:Protein-cysteine N-palmitoyltransferase Rasp n=1 Tax=Thelazia callipaeda TaxID=103827 RepID=A0A158RAL0_THECL|nr:unnamed protein product [Thelazia callipaeda]
MTAEDLKSTTTNSKRKVVSFVYADLPTFELCLYCCFLFSCTSYAWFQVLATSNNYKFNIGQLASLKTLPFFGQRFKDESNWEWNNWSSLALSLLPFLLIHSIIFNTAERFVSDQVLQYITIIYSVIYSSVLFTKWLVFLSLFQGTLIFLVTHLTGYWIATWISSLPVLYLTMHHTFEISPNPFLVLTFVSYTLLSYISYNLEAQAGGARPEDNTWLKRYIRMLFYTFYPPYMITLVVTYADFERQMRERVMKIHEWRNVLFLVVRIAFWWVFIDLLLHFAYFEGILFDLEYAKRLPKDQFVSLGMALGTFFHLKYVVIFGLPRIFALADKMQPVDGPICINRLVLYSKAWRYFDRGLYSFFKKYIFIPICRPTFSMTRKVIGVLISYGFVLLWHGFYHSNIVWISLNIIGLFLEYGAKAIYTIESFQKWREMHISDLAFRRILAWLRVIPFVLGIYSNFYFLGGSEVGYMFVLRIWLEETLTLRYPAIFLITLAYAHSQICIEVDRKFDSVSSKAHSE